MTMVSFELLMPNRASWNGRWSGEGNLYARVQNLPEKKADEIIKTGSYFYSFGDGWSASVSVRLVNRSEVSKIRKHSKGFSGYDWMIDSIKEHGKILVKDENTNSQE